MSGIYELYQDGVLIESVDTRDLASEKLKLKSEINKVKDEIFNSGYFTFNGYNFDINATAQANIQGTILSVASGIPLPEGFSWRTRDNTFMPADGQTMLALGNAAMTYVYKVFATSWGKKDYVDTISDLATLSAIWDAMIYTGWPDHDPFVN